MSMCYTRFHKYEIAKAFHLLFSFIPDGKYYPE